MSSAIEELLRFNGPVQATGRVAKEDIEIGGSDSEGGPGRVRRSWAPPTTTRRKFADPERAGHHAATRPTTWPSATASTSAWALRWPARRRRSRFGSLLEALPEDRAWRATPKWGGTFIIRGVKNLPLTV